MKNKVNIKLTKEQLLTLQFMLSDYIYIRDNISDDYEPEEIDIYNLIESL